MQPWQGGGAPWCIGSVFPAPQLLAGTAAISLGPLLFDGIGMPQRLLSTGSPLPLFESFMPSVPEQKEEYLSFSGDAYVPEDLLEEHLQEDTVLRKGFSAYSSQILGNRLQLVECRDGDCALFFPTGHNVDRVGGALCSRETPKKWHVSTNATSHHSLQSTSIPLRQSIFQLSAVRKDPWDPDCGFLVAARSFYKVQFLAANQEGLEINFALPTTANFGKRVSHVAWNQHMQGESAVVLETGEVLIFDLQRGWSTNDVIAKASYNIPEASNTSTLFSVRTRRIGKPRSRVAMHKKRIKPPPVRNPFEWWQCEYAWHPKMLLLAGSREVSLLDLRVKHGFVADHSGSSSTSSEHVVQNFNTSVVARVPGVGRTAGYLNHAGANEEISSFARADHDGSYEFCISTKKHVILFDTRQSRTPLLQWLHGMEAEPPSLLTMCPIPSTSQESSGTPSSKGIVILAASFHSGSVRAFCYGPDSTPSLPPPSGLVSTSIPSHLDDGIHAWGLPSRVIAPKGKSNSWATILDNGMNFFQQENRKAGSSTRTLDSLCGLVLLPRSTHGVEAQDYLGDCRGFSLMQLTEEGDILAQHYQAADRLQSVEPHVHPMQNSDADPTGIKSRSKRCNITKLECFLNCILKSIVSKWNHDDLLLFSASVSHTDTPFSFLVQIESETYAQSRCDQNIELFNCCIYCCGCNMLEGVREDIRNGSGLPESSDSKHSKSNHEPDDETMESSPASEDERALVPWGSPAGTPLYQLMSQAENSELEEDSYFLDLHEDSNRKKVTALVTEALQQMSAPLSIYEIAHVVLRRNLSADLEKLAAGMPADVRLNQRRKYLSFLLAAEAPPEGSIVEKDSEEDDVGSGMEGLSVPLPVLLDVFSLESREKTRENRQGKVDTLAMVTRESSSPRRSVLEEGCDHVRRALDNLSATMKSREPVLDLSLADSVEAWNDLSLDTGGLDTSHPVQYQTSDRETILPSIYGKPIRGQALNMASPTAIASGVGGNFAEAEGRRSSDPDRHVFGTFFGTFADGYHGAFAEKVLKDEHLCPIQLPFVASSQDANETGLSGLRNQFKQWQDSFVPYQNFCQSRVPSQ